jgi:hypothetical protein
VSHEVFWHGVFRGTEADPREVGFCETCGQEVYDRDGKHRVDRDNDHEPRPPGCQCTWEAGDSPCPVHGLDEDPHA